MIFDLLCEKWLWITILCSIIIVAGPLLVAFILTLPPELIMTSITLILIGSGIASGYKDWIIAKSKKQKIKRKVEI